MSKPSEPITPSAITTRLAATDMAVTADQAASLAIYLEMLSSWNRRINLVGHVAWTEILDDLVADSLHLAAFLASSEVAGLLGSAGGEPVALDFGAGAGLPGIPLRILWPRGDYVLIEVRAKRAVFLAEALARLSLPRTTVFSGRAEEAPGRLVTPDRPDRPGLVLGLSRAFLPWPRFLAFAATHLGDLGRPVAVLCMTGDRPGDDPGAIGGAGWALCAESAYAVLGKTRYLSLFVPKNASRALPLKMS